MKTIQISISVFIFLGIIFVGGYAEAKSGCCSSHKGVRSDGCGCNDGTALSVTCAPYYSCTTYKAKPSIISCPVNSTLNNGICYCNTGYEPSKKEYKCLTLDQLCTEQVGPSTYRKYPDGVFGGGSACNCIAGYIWDISSLHCLNTKTVTKIIPSITQIEVTKNKTSIFKKFTNWFK